MGQLPDTLEKAQTQLDELEGLIDLHSNEIIEELAENGEYQGLYQDKIVETMVEADQEVSKAETEFFNYEEDLKEVLKGEKRPEKLEEETGVPTTEDQYQHNYRKAVELSHRYDRLEAQFKALSKIMKQNHLGQLQEEYREKHPWLEEPEEASGFKTAAEI